MRKLIRPPSQRSAPVVMEEGALILDSVARSSRKPPARLSQQEQAREKLAITHNETIHHVNSINDQDDDESHDYDSFGSLPKGEVSRRIRKGFGGRSRALVHTPRGGMRLNNSSIDSCSTVRRAAVAMDPRLRRRRKQNIQRDPPTEGSRGSASNSSSRDSRDQTLDCRDDTEGLSNTVRRMPIRNRFPTRRPYMPGTSIGDASSSSMVSDELTEEIEREFDEQHGREGVSGASTNASQLPPRPPRVDGSEPAAKVVGARPSPRIARRSSLSLSERSSASSKETPVYLPEDSTYLLYGYADWADLPSNQNDPELHKIRQRFLQQNSSLSSTNSPCDPSVSPGKSLAVSKLYSDEEELDTEGLPKGFFRRKDGVIQSFGSSNDSSSKRRNARYANRPNQHHDQTTQNTSKDGAEAMSSTEWSETRDTGGSTMDTTKYGTPMAWLHESNNSIVASDASDTKNDSTWYTQNNESTVPSETDKNHDNGLMTAFVRSFEETMSGFQTGNRFTNPKEGSEQRQTRSNEGSAVSTASTPSSVRRAKVKVITGVTAAAPNAVASSRSRQQQIERRVPPVPQGWGFDPTRHSVSFSESEGYDDSTITTKESRMPSNRAVVDVSRLPQEERPEYLEPLVEEPLVNYHPVRDRDRKTEEKKRPDSERNLKHVEKYAHADDPYFLQDGAARYFPEPTRRGDRVPEAIPTKGAATAPSVVSDISSLPKSKEHNNFVDVASMNNYDGLSVDDNITGFIDKMALALRLAVFQPNGCR